MSIYGKVLYGLIAGPQAGFLMRSDGRAANPIGTTGLEALHAPPVRRPPMQPIGQGSLGSRSIVALAVAFLLPSVLLAVSVIIFPLYEFGLPMNPAGVAAVNFAVFGPPICGFIAICAMGWKLGVSWWPLWSFVPTLILTPFAYAVSFLSLMLIALIRCGA